MVRYAATEGHLVICDRSPDKCWDRERGAKTPTAETLGDMRKLSARRPHLEPGMLHGSQDALPKRTRRVAEPPSWAVPPNGSQQKVQTDKSGPYYAAQVDWARSMVDSISS